MPFQAIYTTQVLGGILALFYGIPRIEPKPTSALVSHQLILAPSVQHPAVSLSAAMQHASVPVPVPAAIL